MRFEVSFGLWVQEQGNIYEDLSVRSCAESVCAQCACAKCPCLWVH